MNATASTIILYLSPQEADILVALRESNAFNVQYGKVVMNFAGGILQNVIKEEIVYKR